MVVYGSELPSLSMGEDDSQQLDLSVKNVAESSDGLI